MCWCSPNTVLSAVAWMLTLNPDFPMLFGTPFPEKLLKVSYCCWFLHLTSIYCHLLFELWDIGVCIHGYHEAMRWWPMLQGVDYWWFLPWRPIACVLLCRCCCFLRCIPLQCLLKVLFVNDLNVVAFACLFSILLNYIGDVIDYPCCLSCC